MTEDDEVRRVRASAEAEEWTPENLASKLDDWDPLTPRVMERMKAEGQQWAPLLRSLIEEGSPASSRQLMNAGFLLLEIGDPGGTSALLRALEGGDFVIWIGIMVRLSIGAAPPPLDTRMFAPSILASLEDPQHPVAVSAIRVATRFRIAEAESRLRELLEDPSEEIRSEAICALLELRPEPTVFEAAETLILHASESRHELRLAGALGKAASSEVGERSALADAILARYAGLCAGTQDNTQANAVFFALRHLADAAHPEAGPLLEKTIESDALPWLRSGCLERLARLKGSESLALIMKSLSDPLLAEGSAGALGTLLGTGALTALPSDIVGIIEGWTEPEALGRIARALMATGVQEIRPILSRVADRMDPRDAMSVRWHLAGLTPRKAAHILVAQGILASEPDEQHLEALDAQWKKERRPFVILQDLLQGAGILTAFDREYWCTPIDYDDVIRMLSEGSGGLFRPEAIVQEHRDAPAEGDTGYSIELVCEGRLHAFSARDHGDWIDVESLLRGVNRILAESGRSEKFLEIEVRGQVSFIFFGNDVGLRKAAGEFFLPLAT